MEGVMHMLPPQRAYHRAGQTGINSRRAVEPTYGACQCTAEVPLRASMVGVPMLAFAEQQRCRGAEL
jgi:hypothetical protein